MLYAEIPFVDKKVSRILFGTSMKPFNIGVRDDALLDAVVSMGINTIDTARVYGEAEDTLGLWLDARGNRDQLVLLSKCGHFDTVTQEKRVNPAAMHADLATSLEKLHTDYIDIYLLHRDDPEMPVGPIVETFNEMHAAGKIGAFGGSNWTQQRIEEANEYAASHNLIPFTVSSPHFSLAEQFEDPWGQDCISIAGKSGAEGRAWYRRTQMPIFAYSSLAHGFLSGQLTSSDTTNSAGALDAPAMKGYGHPENFERLRRCELLAEELHTTVPQLAMAWLFHQNLNVFAIVSSTKVHRMKQNIDALQLPLTEQDCRYLNLEIDAR